MALAVRGHSDGAAVKLHDCVGDCEVHAQARSYACVIDCGCTRDTCQHHATYVPKTHQDDKCITTHTHEHFAHKHKYLLHRPMPEPCPFCSLPALNCTISLNRRFWFSWYTHLVCKNIYMVRLQHRCGFKRTDTYLGDAGAGVGHADAHHAHTGKHLHATYYTATASQLNEIMHANTQLHIPVGLTSPDLLRRASWPVRRCARIE